MCLTSGKERPEDRPDAAADGGVGPSPLHSPDRTGGREAVGHGLHQCGHVPPFRPPGGGAVMGAKNLKAIGDRGGRVLPSPDRKEYGPALPEVYGTSLQRR